MARRRKRNRKTAGARLQKGETARYMRRNGDSERVWARRPDFETD